MKKSVSVSLITVLVLAAAGAGTPSFSQEPDWKPFYSGTDLPAALPGTSPLVAPPDLSIELVHGAHRFIDRKISASVAARQRLWQRDFRSRESYERSVHANRERFRTIIGIPPVKDDRFDFHVAFRGHDTPVALEKFAFNNEGATVSETSRFNVYQVRWPAVGGVEGEGLLLEPKSAPRGNVIALPDADQLPEQLAGLRPGVADASQFARHLAEQGYRVIIPVIISRTFLFPGKTQQQTHREWIYRQAFHMGRHVIGYEVQKILALADWFRKFYPDQRIGVAGYHEGGLLALYAAAADTRIDAALVSGYFNSRQQVWDEPLYRNVWGLLSEFGDAEIATLIAPRTLVIEHSAIPELTEQLAGPEKEPMKVGDWPYTGYKGKLRTPDHESIAAEVRRIDELIPAGFQQHPLVAGKQQTPVAFGSPAALALFMTAMGHKALPAGKAEIPVDQRKFFNPEARQLRQVQQMEHLVQALARDSDQARNREFLYKVMPEFQARTWSTKVSHPTYNPDHFIREAEHYRNLFHEEIMGKFEDTMLPPGAESRKLYDRAKWAGYEVRLDVYDELQAAGILLVPKGIKPGERRPVVVCQHGRDDIPHKLVEGNFSAYNNTAALLADRGFIVYAPYNPYRGEDLYRFLDRKANTLKKTFFSFVIAQHDQALRWLATLPFVDEKRIAFYGLSYGGETAMRVPAVLKGYCLSICSGDFGDWTRKVTDTHFRNGYMNTLEWEMPYFNMGGTFSYAEMAYLIFPRPLMVERGHDDLVQPDEWVAYEYGKVKYFYDQFGLGDNTDIEFFNGGHSMRANKTVKFLHTHLRWPENP